MGLQDHVIVLFLHNVFIVALLSYIVTAIVPLLSVPKDLPVRGLVPRVAELGGGGTYRRWGLVGGV